MRLHAVNRFHQQQRYQKKRQRYYRSIRAPATQALQPMHILAWAPMNEKSGPMGLEDQYKRRQERFEGRKMKKAGEGAKVLRNASVNMTS
jgi:hypothetical protein